MYRTTAKAVSGTNVFADGKWLKCIGNKPVHVGDRIWTDGRCVFGFFLESQQPIITSKKTIADFPILLLEGRDAEINKFTSFNPSKKTLKELQTEEEYAGNRILINDATSTVYALKNVLGYSAIRSRQWIETWSGDYVFNYKQFVYGGFIAANIENEILYSLFVTKGVVQIKRDDEIVQTVDLNPFLEKVISDCETPPDVLFPHEANDFDTIASLQLKHAFIDNQDNWAFVVECSCEKTSLYGMPPEYISPVYSLFNPEIPSVTTYSDSFILVSSKKGVEYSPSKIPLPDNYYFTMKEFTTEWFDGALLTTYVFSDIDVFDANDHKIFSGLFSPHLYLLNICKVKGGFLLASCANRPNRGFNEHYSRLYFYDGLFLLSGGKWTTLSTLSCLNSRLRPLKHSKGWQNRVIFKDQ